MGLAAFSGLDQKIKFFRNNSDQTNNWIQIKLAGNTQTNYSAIGCKVRLWTGGKMQIREVDGGSGHASQSSKTLHFGLGTNSKIDSIEIVWLNSTAVRYYNLQSNSFITIYESGNMVGLQEYKPNASEIYLYPNPTIDNCTIYISKEIYIQNISLLDELGRTIDQSFTPSENDNLIEIKMNMASLSKGSYVLRINNQITKRIIKL